MDINGFYIHQHYDYVVGNFIMCTPTIKALSDHYNQPINVNFDNKVSEVMFEKCPFINIINKSETSNKKILFASSLINQVIPDYQFMYETVLPKLNIPLGEIPMTYVDSHDKPEEIPFDEYCLILRGANHNQSSWWKSLKDIGDETYNNIISKINLPIVFVGSTEDYTHYISKMCNIDNPHVIILDDIKKTLGAITHAKYIVSNDTGVYHASAALQKDIFVMWKDTLPIKNGTPSKTVTNSYKGNWLADYDEWIKTRDI